MSDEPHFGGLFIAILVFALLVVWWRRTWTVAGRSARDRVLGFLGLCVVAAIAVFGNSPYRTRLSTIVQIPLPGVEPATLDAAVRTAFSDEFINYYAQLTNRKSVKGSDMAARLQIGLAGAHAAKVNYVDDTNQVYAVFFGRETRDARFQFAQDLSNLYLTELVALERLRAAASDVERMVVLRSIGQDAVGGVPHAVEWVARDLRRMKARGCTPELAAAIDARLKQYQDVIDHPELRGIHGRAITLSVP